MLYQERQKEIERERKRDRERENKVVLIVREGSVELAGRSTRFVLVEVGRIGLAVCSGDEKE